MCKALDKLYPPFFSGKPGLGLLGIRLAMGAAFILHGLPKIQAPMNWMGDSIPGFLQFLAALSEFGGGIALILGVLTPLACMGLICTMLVAMFMVHIPAGHPFVSSDGGPTYELALVYLASSLGLLMLGPGAYSLDARLIAREPATASPEA